MSKKLIRDRRDTVLSLAAMTGHAPNDDDELCATCIAFMSLIEPEDMAKMFHEEHDKISSLDGGSEVIRWEDLPEEIRALEMAIAETVMARIMDKLTDV